jgi:uncharacterized membrane protein YedE/YeeE
MRKFVAFLCGGLFGAGLVISGMTNTVRIQSWLDIFGDWDPTLAFVLGGAILPMAVAWRIAARLGAPRLGGVLPATPAIGVDRGLVIGSSLFGLGWGLSGLCPGPSVAILLFGGWPGVLFLLAMLAGMVAAPMLRARIDRLADA